MILGVLSDTHGDKAKAIPWIIHQFKKRGVELIIHCGDIIGNHVDVDLFGNLPVICALVDGEEEKAEFQNPPEGWRFTKPGQRIVPIDDMKVYVGHKRPVEFLLKSEEEFINVLNGIRQDNDGLRLIFGGHTHSGTYVQGKLVSMVNPGAVESSGNWGYEYAVVDTDIDQVVFSRILPVPPTEKTFTVGVISDSLNVSKLDPCFWGKLRKEFQARDVSRVIHCGNIALEDLGREELNCFQVFCNLRLDQQMKLKVSKKELPDNWTLIDSKEPVVDINGYRFYVKLDLSLGFLKESEHGIDQFAMGIRRDFPETSFVLCGFTNQALYVEGEQVRIINPGDVNHDHSFATIFLPSFEITFGHVPVPPLDPPID